MASIYVNMGAALLAQEEASASIDELVLHFLKLNELDLLEETPMMEAVKDYVDKARLTPVQTF